MHKDYKDLIDAQFRADQRSFTASSEATKNAYGQAGFNAEAPYPERNPSSIHSRFKDIIAPRVMKFLGIEETLPRESGKNDEDFYLACKAAYGKRHPKGGNFDDLRQCKEYLSDKAKFTSYRSKLQSADDSNRKALVRGKYELQMAEIEAKKRKLMQETIHTSSAARRNAAGIPSSIAAKPKKHEHIYLSDDNSSSDISPLDHA